MSPMVSGVEPYAKPDNAKPLVAITILPDNQIRFTTDAFIYESFSKYFLFSFRRSIALPLVNAVSTMNRATLNRSLAVYAIYQNKTVGKLPELLAFSSKVFEW
jgi:hypothetical protein